MSNELVVVPPTSQEAAPPSNHSHGSGGGSPIGKVLDPFRWYFSWVRNNPESATSLEQMSRTFTLFVSDPTNLINSEACFTVCKLHAMSNHAIISTGGHRTTKTEILGFILQAIQEVECLLEIVYRKYAGHRSTWNAMLLLEAIKCTLKTCVHRQTFLVPWLWESLKMSLRRALRHLVPFSSRRRRVRGSPGNGGLVGSNGADGGAGAGSGVFPSGSVSDSGVTGTLEYGSSSLRGSVMGPNNTRLVIPRVASDRRHEHRHVFTAYTAEDAEGRVLVEVDADIDVEEVEENEAIPFTCIDVLGMVLDLYLLARPLVMVAVARHAFLQLPEAETQSIAVLPPVLTRAQQQAAVKEAEAAAKAAKEAAKAGQPAPPAHVGPDPLAALHKAIYAGPQQTLMSSWKGWATMAGCDLLVAFLSRVVRYNRVPVVYIGAAAGEAECNGKGPEENGAPPLIADGEEAQAEQEEGEAALDGTVNGPNVIAPIQDPPVVSRDRMRVQQALRNIFYGFFRDPFFSAVLKQFFYRHFVQGFVSRIPLLGPCISFYVIHYMSMQHYSFLYTLGQ